MGGTRGPVGMLNNNQLANSDFYTGAFPAEFGNALWGGSHIHMTPDMSDDDKWQPGDKGEDTDETNRKNIREQVYNAARKEYDNTYQTGFTPMGGCRVYF
jgi:hypothetical protein